VKQILIIKLSSLGDLFRPLPAVHLLKKHLPADIDWVTQPEYVELVRHFKDVRNVFSYPRKAFIKNAPAYIRAVRKRKYDYIIDMQGLLKSAVAARFARGGLRLGPSFHREGARFLYDVVAGEKDKNRHSSEEMLDVIRMLDLTVDESCYPVAFNSETLMEPEPRVALLPCSRWPTKNWPPAHFIQLGKMLCKQGVRSIFLLGAPADQNVCNEIEAGIGEGVCNLCGKTSLTELGGILKQMNLVIGVDSGPLHLAATTDVPIVAIYGATDPLRTGPCAERQTILCAENLSCRPCLSRMCERSDLACLEQISPRQVLDAANKWLKGVVDYRTRG